MDSFWQVATGKKRNPYHGGLTDPDQQEEGGMLHALGWEEYLCPSLVLPCPTVTVNGHVQNISLRSAWLPRVQTLKNKHLGSTTS